MATGLAATRPRRNRAGTPLEGAFVMLLRFAVAAAIALSIAGAAPGVATAQPGDDLAARMHPKRGRGIGWGTFGGELGFFLGVGSTMALVLSQESDPPPMAMPGMAEPGRDGAPAAALGIVALTTGATVGGAWLFSHLAVEG